MNERPIEPDHRTRPRRGRILLGAGIVVLLAAGTWAFLIPIGLPWSGPLSGLYRPDPAAFGPAVADAHAECARVSRRERRDCYGRALTRIVVEDGPEAALEALEGLAAVDGSAERDAHHHAHHIGIEAYRHAADLRDVFPRCTEAFSSGCYHGVIQAHFLAVGQVDEGVLRATCRPYRGRGGDAWLHFQCLHGLGHGLVLHMAGDLFGALGACDALETRYQRESCYGGAFMENIVGTHHPHAAPDDAAHETLAGDAAPDRPGTDETRAAEADHDAHAGHDAHADHDARDPHAAHTDPPHGAREPMPPALDPDDPLYPCTAVEQRYVRACYGMQSSAILRFADGDLKEVARVCAEAPSEGRSACFDGLARDVAGRARFHPRRAHRSCTRLQQDGETWCFTEVARNLVNFEARPDLAFQFCGRVEEPEGRSACFQTTGRMLRFVEPEAEDRARLCGGAADSTDAEACRRGAGIRSGD